MRTRLGLSLALTLAAFCVVARCEKNKITFNEAFESTIKCSNVYALRSAVVVKDNGENVVTTTNTNTNTITSSSVYHVCACARLFFLFFHTSL